MPAIQQQQQKTLWITTGVVLLLGLVVYIQQKKSEKEYHGNMPQLPKTVVKYSQVPKQGVFTATQIPKGLLREHSTRAGTWGVIRVLQGTLEYQIHKPPQKSFRLSAPATGIIEPKVLHQVRPLSEDVEFVVEFHREPGTGPVKEQREGL